MKRLTVDQERRLLKALPRIMSLPCNEYDAKYCAYCRQESNCYSGTLAHAPDCILAELFTTLSKEMKP